MKIIEKIVTENNGFYASPPNDHQNTEWIIIEKGYKENKYFTHEILACFNNDAYEIWLSEKWTEGLILSNTKNIEEKWVFHCPCSYFRKIAIWYLWRWAYGEWFGLRRWFFYKWLHKQVQKQIKN